MDGKLYEELLDTAPKFNQKLVQGWAVYEMQYVERYVEEHIWKLAAREFPSNLTYDRCERCTPEEWVRELENKQGTQKRTAFETAPSHMYMVKYIFRFNGQELPPLYLMLPFVGEGGTLMIRGSLFHIMPVIADRSLSVGTDTIFLPVSRANMNFSRSAYSFKLNGERETPYLVHAMLHNKAVKSGGRGRAAINNLKTTMAHYLFARYGVEETFRRYCNAEIAIGYPDTVNQISHPPSDWVICSSFHDDVEDHVYRPVGTQLRIAIRRQVDENGKSYLNRGVNRITLAMVAGFFYIADHFPEQVVPGSAEDNELWVVLLGQLLFGQSVSVGMLIEHVHAHLLSLSNALDPAARDALVREGIECENLYDVMANLTDTFHERVTNAVKTVSSMYGKQLTILRYVMKDLTRQANKFMFQLTKIAMSRRRPLTREDVIHQMRRYIKWDLLYKITNPDHGEVVSVNCPGDNMLFKLTTPAVLQSESSGPRSRSGTARGRAGVDASKYLDVSIATHGSYNTMSKSEPSGRNRLNPYGTYDDEGVLFMDPKLASLLNEVQALIQH